MANGPALSTAGRREIYVGSEFRDSISLLDVLHANQFEGESLDPKVLEQIEENFYRGAPAKWENFYISEHANESGGIIKRDGYDRLVEQIRHKRKKYPGISTVKLFHQPGCGGTTLAMQVLWDLRKSFRCAVLTSSPANTTNVANEVISLYTAGGRGHQNTVLLLVNSEQFLENLQHSIMEKIAEQEIVTHMPVVIFLSCVRKASIVQNDNVFLKDELSDTEKQKFDEKKEELSRKYRDKCEKFHGFNIMQTDFSPDYVQQACEEFSTVNPVTVNPVSQLVAFLSLLNGYVPGSYLTESQCLDFLKHEDNNENLEDIMWPFSHLITFQQDERSGKKVSMAHPMIAQCCTELLAEAGLTRSDTAKNFLNCLCSYEVPPYLVGFVKDMLTKREQIKEENPSSGTETDKDALFSRLILDIKEKEGNIENGASVLKVASERFDENPFFPQALARFYYIELKDYDEAEMWAKRAKERDPQNSFVADTLGQVHQKHLKTSSQPREILEIAKEAIKAFQHEERLAENEVKDHGTTNVFNTAGMVGCLEVYNILYDKIGNKHLNDLISKDEVEQKCTFLEKYVICSKPAMMKNYTTKISKAIEYYRSYAGGSQQFKQTDTDFIQKLKQILDDTSTVVLSCLDREHSEVKKKITTWWEEIVGPSSSEFKHKMPLGPNNKPELHLVSLLLCWPTDGEDKCEILSQVIQRMHDSYEHAYKAYFRSRYLRPLFFIGKGQGLDRIVHRNFLEELFLTENEETKVDWSNDKIFQDPMVQEHLIKVKGVVRNYRIYATVGGKETEVEANQKNSLWKARKVSFYIGFTIRGPVAFGVQTKTAEEAEVASEVAEISNPEPSISDTPSASGQHFVDRHRTALINNVSDTEFILRKLKDKNLISNDTCNVVSVLNTPADQMEGILQCLTRSSAKDALLDILKGMKSMKALLRELEESE